MAKKRVEGSPRGEGKERQEKGTKEMPKQPLKSVYNEPPGSQQKTTSKSVNQTKYQNKNRKLTYLIREKL